MQGGLFDVALGDFIYHYSAYFSSEYQIPLISVAGCTAFRGQQSF